MQLLSSPLTAAFDDFLARIETNGLICSPYISAGPMRRLASVLEAKGIAPAVSLTVITDLSVKALVQNSTDLDALIEAADRVPNTAVTYLPRIHAKVFAADERLALIGSFNCTTGGLARNFEYGVRVDDPSVVRKIRQDIGSYAALGSTITAQELRRLKRRVDALRDSIRDAQDTVKRECGAAVRDLQTEAEHGLLRVRLQDRSLQSIFSDTIRYLLGQGPLTTPQIYEQIRALHSDLCDDDAIRIISGDPRIVWRHRVRHAQQALRAQGAITRDAETRSWRLLGP